MTNPRELAARLRELDEWWNWNGPDRRRYVAVLRSDRDDIAAALEAGADAIEALAGVRDAVKALNRAEAAWDSVVCDTKHSREESDAIADDRYEAGQAVIEAARRGSAISLTWTRPRLAQAIRATARALSGEQANG